LQTPIGTFEDPIGSFLDNMAVVIVGKECIAKTPKPAILLKSRLFIYLNLIESLYLYFT
jgi:hypothetical protein